MKDQDKTGEDATPVEKIETITEILSFSNENEIGPKYKYNRHHKFWWLTNHTY